jgi:hypothetical protein
MAIQLRLSTTPGEYFYDKDIYGKRNPPGLLRYTADSVNFLILSVPDNEIDYGWTFCEHTLENLRRVTPNTSNGRQPWKILLMIQRTTETGEIWLKAALQNRTTGKIALITSTNKKETLTLAQHKAIQTIDGEWFVGQYRMAAPTMFWKELKHRLIY